MVRFFIDRPIFATVLSLAITLAGALAVGTLPLSQYPPVTPPTIQVDCNYPGASAQVVAEAIAAPVEQQVNGVEKMLYMTSQCTSDGSYTLTVTFDIGTDLNMAQVLVQNRVNLALPNLPDVVRATGVTTRKRSPEILMTVSLNSPSGKYDQLYLSNYALTRMKDDLSRLPGISDVTLFGQRDFSMRIWVDPDKLAARSLTALDVVRAVREQNAQVAAGQISQPPLARNGPVQFTLTTKGRLAEVSDFEEIIVRAKDGVLVKVRDVARVELGSKNQDVSNRFDNKPTIGLAIFLLTGANALETGDMVQATVDQMRLDMPEGMNVEIGYDTTPFIRESIHEVFKALRDAVILVALVVLLFLQSWRAAIIPLAAVPVAIVGTFATMWMFGYSLNNLTLFGLVLAVGIVVDDAIVVVEAVQHHIEKGLKPRKATFKAMEEVTGPVVAIGVVLSAVFVPCAFFSGITGQFFRQFAVTIAVSTLISTMNSLTLSPALAAVMLRSPKSRRDPITWLLDMLLGWLFRIFNWSFERGTNGYVRLVSSAIRVPAIVGVVYLLLLLAGAMGYQIIPGGFIPSQDKGYLIASVQLPDAASAGRTRNAIDKIAAIALDTPGVRHVNSVAGNSFVLSAYGSNFGSMFIILDGFDERRHDASLSADAVMGKLRMRVAKEVPEAQVNVFGAPAVSGLGRAGGFRLMIKDIDEVGYKTLQTETETFIQQANKLPQVVGLFTAYKSGSPQVFLDVDRTSCMAHGVELGEVFGTLQATMGSRYVNDFNNFTRTWQVNVQAEEKYRDQLEDIRQIQVRNRRGEMIPLGALLNAREASGPQIITRHNSKVAAAVNGANAAGISTGEAMGALERLANDQLPRGRMELEWTEITYLEKTSKDTGIYVFLMSIAFVYLVLAGLYESLMLPLAVILVVPVCVVGSLAAVWIANQDVNLFTQVGFVVLIGLACKNAILIVEFAKMARDGGAERRQAVLDACRLRFRPILMTSVAFILGVVPLLTATGAGAEMRRALGTAVFGGMIGVTLFGIVLTPVFFLVIDYIACLGRPHQRSQRPHPLDVPAEVVSTPDETGVSVKPMATSS